MADTYNSRLALKQTARYPVVYHHMQPTCVRCAAARLGIYLQISLKICGRMSGMCDHLLQKRGFASFTARFQRKNEARGHVF